MFFERARELDTSLSYSNFLKRFGRDQQAENLYKEAIEREDWEKVNKSNVQELMAFACRHRYEGMLRKRAIREIAKRIPLTVSEEEREEILDLFSERAQLRATAA